MKFKLSLSIFVMFALLIGGTFAFDVVPSGNYNFKNRYGIYNLKYLNVSTISLNGTLAMTSISDGVLTITGGDITGAGDINSTEFYQNGSKVLDSSDESNLNVNSSTYWDGETSQADLNVNHSDTATTWDGETSQSNLNVNSSTFWSSVSSFVSDWFYDLANVFTFNETHLNTTIRSIANSTYSAGTALTLTGTTFSVTNDAIGDTQLTYNTGQDLTTTSNPTFAGATLNGNLDMKTNKVNFDDGTGLIVDAFNNGYYGLYHQSAAGVGFSVYDSSSRAVKVWKTSDGSTYTPIFAMRGNDGQVTQFGGFGTDVDMNGNAITDATTFRKVSDEGLVLDMPFNSQTIIGNTVLDTSGENNHGTNNGATFNSTGGFNNGGAYTFDGTSNYLTVSPTSSLNVNRVTVCSWLDLSTYNRHPILSYGTSGYGALHYELRAENSGSTEYVRMYVHLTSGSCSATVPSISLNSWNFVCGVYDGSNVLVYLNGNLEDTSSSCSGDIDYTYTTNMYVGRDATYYTNGSIDNVRIYSRSLSSTEIQNLYEQRAESKDSYVSQKYAQVDTSGNIAFSGDITGNLDWTNLQNYPVACPSGSAVTQLDDTITCTDSWVDVSGDTMSGTLNMNSNDITNIDQATITNSDGFGLTISSPDTNNIVYLGKATSGDKYGAFFSRNYDSTETAQPVVRITDDNSGDNQNALQIQQDGTGQGLKITQNGANYGMSILAPDSNNEVLLGKSTTGDKVGAYFYRNYDSSETTSGVVRVVDDNSADNQPALHIQQDGTGYGMYIDQNGNGQALNINTAATTGTGLYVQGTSSFNSAYGLARVISLGAGAAMREESSGSAIADYIVASGTGAGAKIYQYGTGQGMYIEQKNGNEGLWINNPAGYGYTDTYGLFTIYGDSTSTGNMAYLRNEGTGTDLYIDQNSDAKGINVDSEATTKSAIQVTTTTDYTGTADNANVAFLLNKVSTSVTGDNLALRNQGTGRDLFIDQNGDGYGIDVDSESTTQPAINIQNIPSDKAIQLANGDEVVWSSGATITSNSTCLILKSPDGTGIMNVCNT